MKPTNFVFASIIALILGATISPAQNMPPQGQQGGRGPAQQGQQGPPQTMDLATAKKMVAAAEAAAAAANEHVAICVMDSNGDVVLSERMDTVPRIPITTAQGKARSVLMFGMPTGQIADAIRDKKPITASVKAPPMGNGGEITLMRGGLPIMKDGKLVGAIGVGGSSSENDEKYSQIGIDAMAAK
jgi:glc operon protein GlcG